jgi:hypothetical protein
VTDSIVLNSAYLNRNWTSNLEVLAYQSLFTAKGRAFRTATVKCPKDSFTSLGADLNDTFS